MEIIGPYIPYRDLQHDKTDLCVSWRSTEILGPALAFLIITKGNDARTMILSAARIGRDADTIARIAAGLIGAYRGLSAIPPEWTQLILAKNRWLRLEEKSAQLARITRQRQGAKAQAIGRATA